MEGGLMKEFFINWKLARRMKITLLKWKMAWWQNHT